MMYKRFLRALGNQLGECNEGLLLCGINRLYGATLNMVAKRCKFDYIRGISICLVFLFREGHHERDL